jgi:hypothetical protein
MPNVGSPSLRLNISNYSPSSMNSASTLPMSSPTADAASGARVLTFQPSKTPPTIDGSAVLPRANAALTDKLQWFALYLPEALDALNEAAEAILRRYRMTPPQAKPERAMLFTVSENLEYRSFTVSDPNVLVNPDVYRIGCNMRDVLPPRLVAKFEHAVTKARRTQRPSTYTYPVNGHIYRGTVIAPTGTDTIVCSVVKVLNLALSCLVLGGGGGLNI